MIKSIYQRTQGSINNNVELKNYYNEVTLDLLQVTPSQGAPQGSSDLSQLGGVFCHISFRDLSATTAIVYNHYTKCLQQKHKIAVTNFI